MSHPHSIAHHPPRQNYAPQGVSALPQQQPHNSQSVSHNPNRPRQSSPMSTIESTVTRLLVATKQLLESLTQWARGDTSEHEVSDVYVVLGNEFNVACRAFVAAGVEVADLGDVPQALRVILEKALSEDASEENLNKYLPQIREIIVNLLRQLKQKQTTIRANSSAPRPPIAQHPHPQLQHQQQPHQQSAQNPTRPYRNPSSESIDRRQQFNDGRTPQAQQQQRPPQLAAPTPQSPTVPPGHLSPSQSHAPMLRPPSPSKAKDMNALAALQRGEALERRASRRFSAYQFAKLTNGTVPGTEEKVPDLPPLPTSASRTSLLSVRTTAGTTPQKDLSASVSSAHTSPNLENSVATDTSATPETQASATISPELILYLQIGRQVKKTVVQRSDIAIPALRLLFIDKFSYTPGAESFPDIYIQDPHFGVRYELDETTVEDVKEGSLLSLNVDAMDDVKKHIDEGLVGLQKTIESLNQKVEENSAAIAQVSANAVAASGVGTPTRDSRERLSSSSMRHSSSSTTAQNREIESLRRELAVVRQVSSESMRGLRGQASQLIAKIQKMNLSSASSGSRGYMESCHKKLSGDTDHLLTSVDDLQDMIEALRKDVAQRGVRADPKQLHYVSKEIVHAKSSLEKMGVYLTREKPSWKKIWEKELDVICEEQQFFKLQEELLADLADDLEKAEETFSLVEQASTEQHRALRQVQPVFDTVPIDGVVHAKDAVLSEVVALRPNHEQRVEAIQRAARLRKKELEMRQKDEFKEELGEFVAENKLKKSGGVEETERRRLLREQQMLEEQRKNDEEARLMREEERAKKREEKKKDKKKKKKEKKVEEDGELEVDEPVDGGEEQEEGDQTVLVHNVDENTHRHSQDDLL